MTTPDILSLKAAFDAECARLPRQDHAARLALWEAWLASVAPLVAELPPVPEPAPPQRVTFGRIRRQRRTSPGSGNFRHGQEART